MAQIFDMVIAILAITAVIIYSYISYKRENNPSWGEENCYNLLIYDAIAMNIAIITRVFILPLFI